MIKRARQVFRWLAAKWHASEAKYKKLIKYMALAGAVLALVCHHVPAQYRAVCDAFASLCGG